MRKLNAEQVYLTLSGCITLANITMFTVLGVYYVTTIGLNPLQLVLIGTMVEGTILLFEVPTGVVADTYSRRLSVTLGMFVLGVAWLLEGSIPLFSAILMAEFIRGIGETLQSGALDAWLADEVGDTQVGPIYVRAEQINRIVGMAAIGVGVGLASIQINLAILFGGLIYLGAGVFLVLCMPETGFKPAPRQVRNPVADMARTLRAGSLAVRGRPLLFLLVLSSAFWGIASEGYDRLWEAHLLTNFGFPNLGNFQPVVWFGILNFCASLLSLGITSVLRPRLNVISQPPGAAARALIVLKALLAVITLIFALAGHVWLAMSTVLAYGVVRSLAGPLYTAWLVQNIPSQVRATVLSMMSLSNAFGQVAGGPAIGALGNSRGLRTTLVAAGLLILPEIGVYIQASRQTITRQRETVVDQPIG